MNAQGLSKQKRNLIFTNIVISSIASTMLMTALTTALPAIVDEFHVGVAMGQWLTSGYSLVMGLMMPLTALRTMAGVIGGAAFVGIINAVAEKSIVNHGVDAPLQGVKPAFLCMGGVSLLLLLASLLLCEMKRGAK